MDGPQHSGTHFLPLGETHKYHILSCDFQMSPKRVFFDCLLVNTYNQITGPAELGVMVALIDEMAPNVFQCRKGHENKTRHYLTIVSSPPQL